jgi:hypothetical protein
MLDVSEPNHWQKLQSWISSMVSYLILGSFRAIINTLGSIVSEIKRVHLDHYILVARGAAIIHKGCQIQKLIGPWIDFDGTIGKPLQVPHMSSIETFGRTKLREITLPKE